MNKRRAFVLSIVLLSAVTAVGASWAKGTAAVDWAVLGAGGGHTETAPYNSLDGTIGQPVVGTAIDTGSELCSGFWCGVGAAYDIYLPLVLRNA